MKDILFYLNTRQLLAIILVVTLGVFFKSPLFAKILPKEPTPLHPSSFTYRITPSKESMIYFFKCYNNSYYAERILPCFFMHLDDLLANTSKHKNPYIYIKNSFSLFHERLTACSWVNPVAFAALLDQLVVRLKSYFTIPSLNSSLKETLISTCENKLIFLDSSQNTTTKTTKDKAELLAQDLLNILQEREESKSAQTLIIRFLENALGKLIWDARDDIHNWKTFKLLGMQLEQLYKNTIIPDQNTLNNLLWWLVNRFIYWVSELEASAISLTCYQQIIQELSENKISFLQHPEQRSAIIPKTERLLKALETGYAKAYFYHKRGIITGPLPQLSRLSRNSLRESV